MNLQFYFEKLHSSDKYKKFMKENPEAYFCGGFFSIDKENSKNPDNKRHLDFYSSKRKNIFSFQLEERIKIVPSDVKYEKAPERVSERDDFDFSEIEKLINDKMNQKNINSKVQKILISLQNLNGEAFLICTVFISMFGLLKVNIKLKNAKMEITDFEKKSFMDILKISGKKRE